ncbi:hypothetical protein Z544_04021, partial [Mycobacterium tuberculosis UT0103]
SRSSGGYLLDEPPDMTPSFPRTGVSGHAGAVHVVPEVGNRDSAVPVVLAGPVSSVIDEIVREGAQQMLAGAQRRCAASKLVRQRHETAILLGWFNAILLGWFNERQR